MFAIEGNLVISFAWNSGLACVYRWTIRSLLCPIHKRIIGSGAFRNPQLFQHRVKVPLTDVAFTQRVAVPSLKNVPDFFLAYLLSQNPNEHGRNANSTNGIARLGCLYCAFFGFPIPIIA
jgi:hypothetical protein